MTAQFVPAHAAAAQVSRDYWQDVAAEYIAAHDELSRRVRALMAVVDALEQRGSTAVPTDKLRAYLEKP